MGIKITESIHVNKEEFLELLLFKLGSSRNWTKT